MTDWEQWSEQHLMLDAFCHAYEHLLEHLAAFDEAVSIHPDWDGYRLVKQCVNPAAAKFGRMLIDTEDVSVLCADLLHRLKGLLDAELPPHSPLLPVFETYREAVLDSAPLASTDLVQYQQLGEELSQECYRQVCTPDSPNLSRPTELVIKLRNRQNFASHPRKKDGISTIIFEFATGEFDFNSFINLPFFFLHEYFSHIHSAEMYAEKQSGAFADFEDGWLLYAAYQFYRQVLTTSPDLLEISHPDSRKIYAAKYIYQATALDKNRAIRLGYHLAENFEELAGPERFWQLTLQLALTPYDHLPGCLDLQLEFLMRLKTWLRRLAIRPGTEKSEAIELLDLALEDETEPIQSLLEVLVEI